MTPQTSTSQVQTPAMYQVHFQPHIVAQFGSPDRVLVLVTTEFEGIFKNGGVGTYYRNLALRFHQAGWFVILVLCNQKVAFNGNTTFAEVAHIFSLGCLSDVLALTPCHQALLNQADADAFGVDNLGCLFYVQAIAHQFPQARIFVEFHEMLGLGYETTQAQQAGLLPDNCVIGLTMHSGHEWIYRANECFVVSSAKWFDWITENERLSFEQMDLTFHPSNFLKQEVGSYHWKIDHAIRMPYFVPILPEVNAPHSYLPDELQGA